MATGISSRYSQLDLQAKDIEDQMLYNATRKEDSPKYIQRYVPALDPLSAHTAMTQQFGQRRQTAGSYVS